VLESIVIGITSGNLESLMALYESEAAFATQPGNLGHGAPGVREALTGFISMKGKLDLEVTRVLQVGIAGAADHAAASRGDGRTSGPGRSRP
jgi:hypothetical protein